MLLSFMKRACKVLTREQKLEQLHSKKDLIIHIAAPSDTAAPGLGRNLWGDNWAKEELSEALKKLGCLISVSRPDQKPPDVLIHLSGGRISYIYGKPIEKLPDSIYKIAWVYSHPEAPNSQNLRGYDRIYCCSTFFIKKLHTMGYTNALTMLGATSKRPVKVSNKYDVVFVGNNRGPHGMDGRAIINHLKSLGDLPYKIGVFGNNWRGKIPDSWYGGRYYPYPEIQNLYASAKICLQDHRPEMSREGFVSVKLFDIIGSGSFAISDKNIGIRGIFKGAIPEYESPEQLKKLIDHYINHPAERATKIRLGQQTVFKCTWVSRAKLFMREFHG